MQIIIRKKHKVKDVKLFIKFLIHIRKISFKENGP